MFGIGAGELVLILIVGLIVFGPGHLPEVGRAIGKGLKEFRKAQAALTSTLEEVSTEPQKKSSSQIEKIPEEKISVTEQPPHSAMTTDDVINLAKQNPINKENLNEKISTDNAGNAAVADASSSNVDSRGNSNSLSKQPGTTAN